MFGKNLQQNFLLAIGLAILLVGVSWLILTRRIVQPFEKEFSVANENSTILLTKKPASDLLSNSASISYPDDYHYIPSHLMTEGRLLGQAVSKKDGKKYLALIELPSGRFHILRELSSQAETYNVVVHQTRGNDIFFEEFNQEKSESHYYLMNLETTEVKLITSVQNIPAIHYTEAVLTEEVLYMCIADEMNVYRIYHYQLGTETLQIIEDENSATPIVFQDTLYYLKLDNQATQTHLMKYDPSRKLASSLYKTTENNHYMLGVYTNGQQVLKLENRQAVYQLWLGQNLTDFALFYEASWIEKPQYKGNYLSFVGQSNSDKQSRLQYHLIDVSEKIEYLYEDSILLLADDGIFWVSYKKDETEIPKGQVFTNDNSELRYLNLER